MRRAASTTLIVCVILALGAARTEAAIVISPPTTPTPAPTATTAARAASAAPGSGSGSGQYVDPLADLGGGSPTCKVTLDPVAARNCRASGTVESRYPLSSYGFDVQVGFSLTHMEKTFLGALQDVAALFWMALVYALKGVLLLLEWAFSLDLLGAAMASVRQTLAYLHDQVIGQPWFLAALAVLGLWGIWRGLLQQRATQTMVGLLTSVALMVAGLVVLAEPDATVGRASQLTNEASLGVLSAATGHNPSQPTAALGDSMIGVFTGLVHDPWCALEFGSVTYCDRPAPNSHGLTNADVWLQYPAGSDQRTALFHLLKSQPEGGHHSLLQKATHPILSVVGLGGGTSPSVPDKVKKEVAPNPARAALQDSAGTVPRFALLALIAVGMTGAIALLGLLGVRLLLASVMALILLLFTPAVLLAPAFGEGGRATFVAWAQRLLGAIVAKLIYALFLAIVLAAAATIRHLQVGWFATWLLQIAFWWGVLLKRHDLIGLVAAGTPATPQPSTTTQRLLGQAYYGVQLGRSARGVAARLTPPVARAATAITSRRTERRHAQQTAAATLAHDELAQHATTALSAQHRIAQERVTERAQLVKQSRHIDHILTAFDEAHATARATRTEPPVPTREQADLLGRRRDIAQRLATPEIRTASHITSHAARTTARTGSPIAPLDLTDHRRSRAQAHRDELPVEHDQHLRAAGIDPGHYHAAPQPEQRVLREHVARHLEREQVLLAATGDLPDHPAPKPRELRFEPGRLRRRTKAERQQLKTERIQRKLRTPR